MEYRTLKRRQLQPFGRVWDGAGIRGFAKEGYWYHPLVPGLKKALDHSTFVSKTITTDKMKGHLPLTSRHRPALFFPKCIHVNFREAYALNAIGLSNPGIERILEDTQLEKLKGPFFISYMPMLTGDSPGAVAEVQNFIDLIDLYIESIFVARNVGIQLNISCPNVGADLKHLVLQAEALLDQFTPLRVPVVVKLNLLVPPETATIIASHPTCTGLCITNSVPFGTVLPEEWWEKNFPTGSPLARHRGKGGLSGAPIFPFVLDWLLKFRKMDEKTYLNVGGGIMRKDNVSALVRAGADSIFISSVMMLRPWRVPGIIRRAHQLYSAS